jgi:Nas2 N_terminal domain
LEPIRSAKKKQRKTRRHKADGVNQGDTINTHKVLATMEDDNNDTTTTTTAAAAKEAIRKRLEVLDVQRRSLEYESEAIVGELTSTSSEQPNAPPMGVDTPLVDREGFPRADIDVLRARTLRSRLVAIRTDHKTLMKQIEEQLAQLAILTTTSSPPPPGINDGSGSDERKPKENEVSARSAEKPKPKFDPLTGKWVVRNWDGSMYVSSSHLGGGPSTRPEVVGANQCSLILLPPFF